MCRPVACTVHWVSLSVSWTGDTQEDWERETCCWRKGGVGIYTVIRFVWVSAKLCTCIIVSVNGTLYEDKMPRFKGECAHFSFKNILIYTYDDASAKFSTNSHETDNSVAESYDRKKVAFNTLPFTQQHVRECHCCVFVIPATVSSMFFADVLSFIVCFQACGDWQIVLDPRVKG
jgi:hypothetical protein